MTFPTEWAAFVNGSDPFTATIRRDYFPYFTQGKTLKIDLLELYTVNDSELTRRTGDVPADLADALNGDDHASTLRLPADAQVLTPDAHSQVFLIIPYSLGSTRGPSIHS
jgi:hypothetical protein